MSRLGVVLIVVCIALATAEAAVAHATLVATTPGNGASLDRAPTRVVLRFDEPVETVSVAVRVFTAAGASVPVDDARKLTDREVAADLPPDLAPGTYTVAWRVVSVDSHPLRGAFVFAVGQPAGEVADVVQDSLAAERDSGGLRAAQTIARFAALALVLLCLGGPALLLGGRHGPHLVRTTWRVVLGASLGLCLATLVWMAATGAEALGLGLEGLLRLEPLREVVGTSFGQAWAARIALALALAWIAALTLGGRLPARAAALGALGAAAGLAVTFPLSGHARVEGLLGIMSDATHAAAAGAWVGGLAILGLALVTAEDRRSLYADSVPSFSAVAITAVAVLLATGIVNAVVELPGLAALWESTYGRLVLAKSAVLAVLVAAGALQRRVALPRLRREEAGAGRLFRRVVAVELILMVVAIGVTTALVAEPPGRAATAEAVSVTSTVGSLDLKLTVDPARAGRNEVDVYVLDPRNGRGTSVAQIAVSATLP
jgi:copper transport protein